MNLNKMQVKAHKKITINSLQFYILTPQTTKMVKPYSLIKIKLIYTKAFNFHSSVATAEI